MWFQQDDATCHTPHATIDLLREKFKGSTISRNSDLEWPPRSYDLTPLHFFLCGYLKLFIYANKSAAIDALKLNIEIQIREKRLNLLK